MTYSIQQGECPELYHFNTDVTFWDAVTCFDIMFITYTSGMPVEEVSLKKFSPVGPVTGIHHSILFYGMSIYITNIPHRAMKSIKVIYLHTLDNQRCTSGIILCWEHSACIINDHIHIQPSICCPQKRSGTLILLSGTYEMNRCTMRINDII